jgi:hypothetical protein
MYGIKAFIPFVSVLAMILADLRARFRLADFFVRICRAKALLALIFPVAVFLKRFAAPRFVFIFGTLPSFWIDLPLPILPMV